MMNFGAMCGNDLTYFESSLRINLNSRLRFFVGLGYESLSLRNCSMRILETISLAFSLSSAGIIYQGACFESVAFMQSSYALVYWPQYFLSCMSERLNFQFLSGVSRRARKRLRCSSLEICRKNLMTWTLVR